MYVIKIVKESKATLIVLLFYVLLNNLRGSKGKSISILIVFRREIKNYAPAFSD